MQNGPSTTTRNLSTGIDPATFTDDASQLTEDQLGLDRGRRRDVQRRLNGLGLDVKVTGKFDEATREVIKRWQAARGYPSTGNLNRLQHKALLGEIVAFTQGSEGSGDRPVHHSSGGRRYRSGGGGNPGAFMGNMLGGMMDGMFRH